MSYAPVLDYIAGYWPRITRSNPDEQGTLIGLPRPYVIPSDSVMFQEMYYWDSYFTALGLPGTPHEDRIVDMAENMAYLINRFGLIPNGSRYYFLSRSQPPFFTALLWLAYDTLHRRQPAAARDLLARLTAAAVREHETVWLGTAQPHHRQVYRGLSRYFDINYLHELAGAESGWDFTTRCDDRWLDHLPVDLNSILYARELDIARAYDTLGQPDEAARWRARAAARAQTMRELLWDAEAGFFFDYDYVQQRRHPEPSLAGFYPLWAGLATAEQAAQVAETWLPRFLFPGGLVTTLRPQPGRQWAHPNGWAPLHWLVCAGLDRYGYTAAAADIRRRWCDNVAALFARTGCLWEKYNVVEIGGAVEAGVYGGAVAEAAEKGLPGSVPGFGWSNGVFADFVRHLQQAEGASP